MVFTRDFKKVLPQGSNVELNIDLAKELAIFSLGIVVLAVVAISGFTFLRTNFIYSIIFGNHENSACSNVSYVASNSALQCHNLQPTKGP